MRERLQQWIAQLTGRADSSGVPQAPTAPAQSQAQPRAEPIAVLTEVTGTQKAWDLFISHASEDKQEVADPLAALLTDAGLAVWYDRFELRIGDSLREKIDEGLALSRYGIVILSPNFFAKQWPRAELAGLVSSATWSSLLPIWHRVTQDDVRRFSPILADRIGADTSVGLPRIARDIIRVVDRSGPGTPAVDRPSRTARLRRLLEATPGADAIRRFLVLNDNIVLNAFGATAGSLIAGCELGEATVDFAIARRNQTAGVLDWHLLFLVPVELEFRADEAAHTHPGLDREIAAVQSARRWVMNSLPQARKRLRDVQAGVGATILAGRRERMTAGQRQSLSALERYAPGIKIRTYDWLIETTGDLDGRSP